jgi:hypothetical protein
VEGDWWRSNKGTYNRRSKGAKIEKGRKLEFLGVGPRSKQVVVCRLAKTREQDLNRK